MFENNVRRTTKIKDFDIIEEIDNKLLRFKEYKDYLDRIANNKTKLRDEKKGKQNLVLKLKEKQSSLFISKNFFNHVNEKINRLESSFIFNDSIKYKKFNINSIDKEIDNDAKKELKYKKTIRRSGLHNKNDLSESIKVKKKKTTKQSFIKKDSLDSYFDKLNNVLFRNKDLEDNKICDQFGTEKDNSKFFINEENKILNRSRLRNSNSNSNFNIIGSLTNNFGRLTNHMNRHNNTFLKTKTIRVRDTNKNNTYKEDTIIDKVYYFKEKFNNVFSKNIKSVDILNRIIKDERKINEKKAIIKNLESNIETMCLSTINKTEVKKDKYPFKHKSNKIISNTSQHLNTTLSSKDKRKSKYFLEFRDEDDKKSSTMMKLKENSKKVKANFEKYLNPMKDNDETEKETIKNVNRSYNYNNIIFSKKDRSLLEKIELKKEKIIKNCFSESIFDFKKTINSQLTSKTKEEIRNLNESPIKNMNERNKMTMKNDNFDELEDFLCEEEIKKYLLETNSTFKDVNKFLMRNKQIEKSNSFIVKDNRNQNEIEIIKKNSKNYLKLKSCILKRQMILNRKNKLIDKFNNKNEKNEKNEKKIIIPSSSMKNMNGRRLNFINSLNNKSIEVEKKMEGKEKKERKRKKLYSNSSSPYKTLDNDHYILFNPNKMNLKEHKNKILNYDYYFSHTNLIDNVGNSKLKELIIKNIKEDKANYENPQNLYNNKEFKKNKVILTTKGNTNDIMFIQSLDDETIYRLRKHIIKKYGIDMDNDNSIFNRKNNEKSKEKKNEELDELYKLGISKKYCNEGMFKTLHNLEKNYFKTNKLIHKLSKNIICK